MAREDFVREYTDRMINRDADIKKEFERAKTDDERNFLRKSLKYSLMKSYDTYAKEYFENKGIGSYVSTFLRTMGGIADAIGTYMFWTFGGAGFGIKGVGLLEKSVADVIDYYYFAKHAKGTSIKQKISDEAKILGEVLVERAAAYLPLGMGEVADFLRGTNKYDAKITRRAIATAKENFFDYVRKIEEPKIISLDNFKRPSRVLEDNLAMAA